MASYQVPQHIDSTSGAPVDQKSTSNAAHVLDVAVHPGEDAVFDRTWGGPKAVSSAVKTADALINSGPCILYGFIVHVATAVGAITIENGITAGAGATIQTIAVTTAIGSYVLPVGIYCDTGIFLNYAASVTGSVTVIYSPAA